MSPIVAEWLMRRLLPGPVGDALMGDLAEEYEVHVRPSVGPLRARVWFWKQVLHSIPGVWRARTAMRQGLLKDPVPPCSGGGPGPGAFLQDVRYALRGLARRPGFAVVALTTLALGIGANTAMYGVVQGVLLRPLPYDHPDRIVRVWPDWTLPFDLRSALDFSESSQVYEETSAYARGLFTLTSDGEPEIVRGARVMANHFAMLGARPALGRTFLPEEGTDGGPRVVVLGHGLWSRRYGSDPDIVGRTVAISGTPHAVVGVMGPDHQPLESDWELWVPIQVGPAALASGSGMALNGRLRQGMTVADAQAESRRLYREHERAEGRDPSPEDLAALRVVPLEDWLVGETASRLLVLLVAVGFVLVIACANVANLLLALGGARSRELAVRRALGAGRGRILRQLLTEAGVLGLTGGVLGAALATAVVRLGVPLLPPDLPRVQEIRVDTGVILFAAALSLVSVLLFGAVPALRAAGRSVTGGLREGSPGAGGVRQLRLNQGLVAAEVSLAVVLVVGAGLMLRSLWGLSRIDPGFEPQGVLSLRVSPPPTLDAGEVAAFHEQMLDAIRAVPGVRSVGAIQFLPMGPGGWWTRYQVEGHPVPAPDRERVAMRVVTEDYFSTMRIAVRSGRTFTGQDRDDNPRVIVVNEALARQAWVGEDPVGQTLLVGVEDPTPFRVVGVVEDVRQTELRVTSHPEAYVPLSQQAWTSMFYVVRVDGAPARAAPGVRAAVWSVDDRTPISSVSPLAAVVGSTVAGARFFTGLLTAFGALALLLGAVGVYGVMSYVVSLRSRDIGIRMAMGAPRTRVLSGIVLRGMKPVGLGLTLGIAGALASGRALGTALYEVRPTDPLTLVVVSVVLGSVALAALYAPARRASRVDPMRVLREQ